MSSDEFERRFNNRIDTIVENQARFSEDMDRLKDALMALVNVARQHDEQIDDGKAKSERIRENQARFSEDMDKVRENQARFSEDMDRVREALASLVHVARHHDEQIDALIEQDKATRAVLNETTEKVGQLSDNMNALIRVVEGHVSNHP